MTSVVLVAACSDDTSGPDPASVRTFTSAELCALLPARAVADATGLTVRRASPSRGEGAACVYRVDPGWTLHVQVEQPIHDLEGHVGRAGYEWILDENAEAGIEAATVEPMDGVGDGASFLVGLTVGVVAYEGDQVVVIHGGDLTRDDGAALARELFAAIDARAA